jgi:hypothetical protein
VFRVNKRGRCFSQKVENLPDLLAGQKIEPSFVNTQVGGTSRAQQKLRIGDFPVMIPATPFE